MSSTPLDPVQPPAEGGFLAPRPGSVPADRCYRCGKPTAPGIALCDACNPGKVKGPSATQLHATILGGVVLGGIFLLLIWKFMVGAGGPYAATLAETTMNADGGPSIVVTITNTGKQSGVANCRVTRDGAPRPDDPTYRTDRIEPGQSVSIERIVPPPPVTSPAYEIDRMSVICT